MEAETIDVHEIMSGLFLGSMKAAMDVDALFALGVRHVLSITNMPIQLPLLRDNPTEKLDHRHVKLTDNADSDLLQVLIFFFPHPGAKKIAKFSKRFCPLVSNTSIRVWKGLLEQS